MTPSEIFKTNIEWWATTLKNLFSEVILKKHPDGWQKGIMIFFKKKRGKN